MSSTGNNIEYNPETIENFVKLSAMISQYFGAKQFDEEAEEFSKLEWYIVNFLGSNTGVTQNELLELIPGDKASIRKAIRRLGRGKYIQHVTTVPHPSDCLALTPKGESINTELTQIDENIASEILKSVPENQMEEFQASIDKILACLSE